MKNSKKVMKASSLSIVFYVLAVIFLAIAAFEIYQGYLQITSLQTQYTLTIIDMLGVYINYCAQYFAYAFMLYGIGVGLSKLHVIHYALSECMVDAQVEEDVQLDEVLVGDTI